MKTILMLTVGLMLAGCGSMENHGRNHGFPPTSAGPLAGPGDRIAVDTICACPVTINSGHSESESEPRLRSPTQQRSSRHRSDLRCAAIRSMARSMALRQ